MAILDGKTLKLDFAVFTTNDVVKTWTGPVGAGVEFAADDYLRVDANGTDVSIYMSEDYPLFGRVYGANPFHGIVITDVNDELPDITSVTIIDNSMTIDPSAITFDSNQVAIDLGGTVITRLENLTVTLGFSIDPTDMSLSAQSVLENHAGAIIGDLSTVDVDQRVGFAYAVDDARFEVVGGQLKLKDGVSLDHEAADIFGVKVTVTDFDHLTYDETFTIAVGNVNEGAQGTDATITIVEDTSYAFAAADFGFSDAVENNVLKEVIIASLPAAGTLLLNGAAVSQGQAVAAADLFYLVWTPPANGFGQGLASFTFKVVDDGGTANNGIDTDATARTITFNVSDTIDRVAGRSDGNDRLVGDDGQNIVRAGKGNDVLLGMGGDDILRSMGGNDRMYGGAGADIFVFSSWSGRDTIMDFETGVDRIDVSRWKAIDSFADLKHAASNHGDDVWISTPRETLVIHDFSKKDLVVGDFIF